jgi:hypothetical protein
MWMIKEEAQHLAGGVGPARICVGAGWTPTEPSVARAMHHPLLDHRSPLRDGE